MTREQKLALIVGFSLVLLVGVLISDHLSRARQAKIASIGPSELPTQVATPPRDPLNTALDRALSATPPSPEVATTQPITGPPAPPVDAVKPEATPTTIAQGSARGSSGVDGHTVLEQAINQQGGYLRMGKDGNIDIIVPAVSTVSAPRSLQPGVPQTSPLAQLPSAKPLATNEPLKYHTVKKGETLFQIATQHYGTGHLWRELAKANSLADKNGSVREGTRLKIPSKDVLTGKPDAAPRPEILPGKKPEIHLASYTVKKGETLGEISKKVLGSSKRWQELAEFNKLDDEDSISAGMVLKVPPMRG